MSDFVQLTLDSDADFVLRSIYLVTDTPIAFFSFNYSGPSGYFYSQSLLPSMVWSFNASEPTPVLPEILYPAGSVIRINIQNTYNTGIVSTVSHSIYFVGVKRFHTGCEEEYDKRFIYAAIKTYVGRN